MEVASLKKGEWLNYRGGQVYMERDNGHSTEVGNLTEGEWSCYNGGQFNGW